MRRDIAARVNDLMLEYSAKLNETVALLRESCSEDEFQVYRKGIGYVMGYMFTEIMTPIYNEHPDLKPPALR